MAAGDVVMTKAADVVAEDALVKAAADLAPRLAERADEAERLAHVHDETIEALEEAGFLRMTIPRTLGGHQVPLSTLLQVLEELAKGCASTSFITTAYAASSWISCLLPDEAREEVFSSENPKAICAINPMGGAASRKEGGFVLSGRWPFCSGQHHAGWALLFALTEGPEGIPEVGLFLVPRSELECANDWQVTGMAATGSDTLSVEETFVPSHRVVRLQDLMSGELLSSLARNDPYYRAPLLPFLSATFQGTLLGMAETALSMFRERIDRRGITYTTYLRQADATVTHFQMAEARMKLDEARFHAERLKQVAESGVSALDIDAMTRARCAGDVGWVIRLCREVIDIVHDASGAQAIHRRDPLQRIVRDMHAVSVHSLLLFNTNAEIYGRVLCGLDSGIPFV